MPPRNTLLASTLSRSHSSKIACQLLTSEEDGHGIALAEVLRAEAQGTIVIAPLICCTRINGMTITWSWCWSRSRSRCWWWRRWRSWWWGRARRKCWVLGADFLLQGFILRHSRCVINLDKWWRTHILAGQEILQDQYLNVLLICQAGLHLSLVDFGSCEACICHYIAVDGSAQVPLDGSLLAWILAGLIVCLGHGDSTHGRLFHEARRCFIVASEICDTTFHERVHVELHIFAKVTKQLIQILLSEFV